MGRRRFAKNAENVCHFRLVARSQNDAHADDPGATPLVLEPYVPVGLQKRSGLSEVELLQIPKSLEAALGPEVFAHERADDNSASGAAACSSAKDQDGWGDDLDDLDGDCYFPKDGYNYEQHLKRVSGGKGGGVVGVILEAPSKVPKKELNLQAATNEDEAEVLRALEHAEEYEELEDEEFEDMLPGGLAQPEDAMLWGPTAAENQDLPDLALFKALRSQSAAAPDGEDEELDVEDLGGEGRGEPGMSAADFDQFLADEYGAEEIGACDEEEIEGPVSLENCEEMLDEYLQGKEAEAEKLHSISEPLKGMKDDVPRVIEETRAIIEKHYSQEVSDEEDTSSGDDSEDESRTWDCETVLSTLSNLSNRPGKIGRIKVVKKSVPTLRPVKEDAKMDGDREDAAAGSGEDVVELPDVITTRPRGETAEERRQRKASVKEMRRVCRKMKKDSKTMYKSEALKMPGQPTGADVRGKTRCFKL